LYAGTLAIRLLLVFVVSWTAALTVTRKYLVIIKLLSTYS
jgi:hypothetical protein